MDICLLWAQDHRGAMGAGDGMPWLGAEDTQRLQGLLDTHPVLMGRRTWEALPGSLRSGRQNFVLTRQLSSVPGAVACASLTDALTMASVLRPAKLFLIGGTPLLQQGLRIADRVYVARFDAHLADGESSAPAVDLKVFDLRGEIRVPRAGPTIVLQEFRRRRHQLH